MYVARLRLYTRWFTCSASAHAQGDKSTLSALRSFYWSTILPSFRLSLSFSPLSLCPGSPCLLSTGPLSRSLSPPLFYLSFGIALRVYAEETHTSAASMQLRFPISVIRTRQNRSTPCRCNGVIQERAFTPARA